MDVHAERMKALIAYTKTSLDTPFPSPFGAAVYSSSGELVAQRYDSVMRDCDVTAHGEVNAIRDACRILGQITLEGCVLYSTCEPCPMCMSSAIWAEGECSADCMLVEYFLWSGRSLVALVAYGAVTSLDAQPYWPQASTLRPSEVLKFQSKDRQPTQLVEELCREQCQELFSLVDAKRKQETLQMPPHRKGDE